ncbi:MAG: hypothetical protein HQL72_00560 [Magnetococcales bacterium]|nr:hypothetical protein [Magnetococcales bacterium]
MINLMENSGGQTHLLPTLIGLMFLLSLALVVFHITLSLRDPWRYYDFTKSIEAIPVIGRVYLALLIIGWVGVVYLGSIGILLLMPDGFIWGFDPLFLKRVFAVSFAFISLYLLKVLDSYAIHLVNKEVWEKEQEELTRLHDGLLNHWGKRAETSVFLESEKRGFLEQARKAEHDENSFMYTGLADRCDDYLRRMKGQEKG